MLLTSLLSLMFLLSASFSRLVTLSSSICIQTMLSFMERFCGILHFCSVLRSLLRVTYSDLRAALPQVCFLLLAVCEARL